MKDWFVVLDWFLARQELHSPDDRARGRFLVGTLMLCCAVGGFFALEVPLTGGPTVFFLVCAGTTLLYAGGLTWLRRTGKVRQLATAWAVAAMVAFFGAAWFGAGFRVLISTWSLLVVLLLTYLTGTSGGVWAVDFLVVAAGMLCTLERLGLYTPNREAIHFMDQPVSMMATAASALVGLVISSSLFEGAQRRSREQLQASLNELHRTQRKLIDASRRAGMAEVASSVLHNVGNVLNSVNVSSSVLAERSRRAAALAVGKLAALFGEHEGRLEALVASPKGAQLASYLKHLAERIDHEQAATVEELASLQRNIDHIKVIVTTQQAHARARGGVTERLTVSQIFDEALRLESSSLQKHGITVERDDCAGELVVDKHKLLQILFNLLANARQAVLAEGACERRIQLSARPLPGDRWELAVRDQGCGIAPQHLSRIFTHGFTTKPDGHGFGLHASALHARELGGTLACDSDGPGRGARFLLTLPAG